MKGSFETIEHYAFVIGMLAFAFMAYSGYSRDGDLINLGLAVTMTLLAILATYYWSFNKWDKDESEDE